MLAEGPQAPWRCTRDVHLWDSIVDLAQQRRGESARAVGTFLMESLYLIRKEFESCLRGASTAGKARGRWPPARCSSPPPSPPPSRKRRNARRPSPSPSTG